MAFRSRQYKPDGRSKTLVYAGEYWYTVVGSCCGEMMMGGPCSVTVTGGVGVAVTVTGGGAVTVITTVAGAASELAAVVVEATGDAGAALPHPASRKPAVDAVAITASAILLVAKTATFFPVSRTDCEALVRDQRNANGRIRSGTTSMLLAVASRSSSVPSSEESGVSAERRRSGPVPSVTGSILRRLLVMSFSSSLGESQPRSTVFPSGPSVCESRFAKQLSMANPSESHQALAAAAVENILGIKVT